MSTDSISNTSIDERAESLFRPGAVCLAIGLILAAFTWLGFHQALLNILIAIAALSGPIVEFFILIVSVAFMVTGTLMILEDKLNWRMWFKPKK